MNVTGPLQVQPQPTTSGFESSLRVNQRVSAEILQVSGIQAVISVEGIPIVARLASAQQGVELANQRRVQFIVAEVNDRSIVLKPAETGQTTAQVVGQVIPEKDVAARLLEESGLPINSETLLLTRAAISQRLVVTPELLQELEATLSRLGNWSDAQAELAAALKAAGLPLTPASHQVAAASATPLSATIGQLADALRAALTSETMPEAVKTALTNALALLEGAMPDWTGSPSQLEAQLKQMIALFGQSFENSLLEQNLGHPNLEENPLYTFVQIQHMLSQAGEKELAEGVGRFLDQVHAAQFLNIQPSLTPGNGAWTQLSFLLRSSYSSGQELTYPARLRIARRSDGRKGGIDPNYTHLSVQVEVEPRQVLQVDLSLAGKQLRAVVTAPDPVWGQTARAEMPELEQSLQSLGYEVQDTQVTIGQVENSTGLLVRPGSKAGMYSVDKEA